jgi:hypothetical protein
MIPLVSAPTAGEARLHTGGHHCGFVLFAELSLADERAPSTAEGNVRRDHGGPAGKAAA